MATLSHMRIALHPPKIPTWLSLPAGWSQGRASTSATAGANRRLPRLWPSLIAFGKSRLASRLTAYLIVGCCAAPFFILAGAWAISGSLQIRPTAPALYGGDAAPTSAAETCFEVRGREGIWWECREATGSLSRVGTVPEHGKPRSWVKTTTDAKGSGTPAWQWAVTGKP